MMGADANSDKKADSDLAAAETLKKAAQARLDAAKLDEQTITQKQENAKAAAFGSIQPTTQSPGKLDVKDDSGKLEAELLAARAIDEIAAFIATNIKDVIDNSCIIFSDAQPPNFHNLALFEMQQVACTELSDKATKASDAADKLAAAIPADQAAYRAGPASPITTIAAFLEVGASIASYLKTDYTLDQITLGTGLDDKLLVTALAGKLKQAEKTVYLTPLWQPSVSDFVKNKLSPLFNGNASSQTQRKAALTKIETPKTPSLTPPQIAAYQEAADLHEMAQQAFQDLIAALKTAGTDGIPWIVKVAEEEGIGTKVNAGAMAVLVHLHASGGGRYTANSLFGSLFRPPVYLGGGAVASYLVLDSKGDVKISGQVQRHSGYSLITQIASEFKSS